MGALQSMILPAQVRDLFNYDPVTGLITWRHHPRKARNYRVGKPAGSATTVRATTGVRYLKIGIRIPGATNTRVFAHGHQIAWAHFYGKWPDHTIDHIDGNGLNNAISNLREVTPSINCRNQRLRAANKSGIPGVVWHKQIRKWQATAGTADCTGRRRCIYLGVYESLMDAAAARKSYEIRNGYGPASGLRSAA